MTVLNGVFPILLTPFDEKERIHEESLRNEVDFVIAAGPRDDAGRRSRARSSGSGTRGKPVTRARRKEIHAREIVPLALLSTTGLRLGHTIHKELLRRQGVIRRANVRSPADPLDELTTRELDELWDELGGGYATQSASRRMTS